MLAYNGAGGEYLVVWFGEDNISPLVDNELEVFGQRCTSGSAHLYLYLPLVLHAGG
jgi:hypothetical protein